MHTLTHNKMLLQGMLIALHLMLPKPVQKPSPPFAKSELRAGNDLKLDMFF